jgi:uncharacterized protein (TIGR03000 family)
MKRIISAAVAALLALSLLASPAFAQRGGGGRSFGGGGRSFSGGGRSFSGARAYGGGSYRGGGSYYRGGGYSRGYGYRGYGWGGVGIGLGWPYYGSSYYAYPNYYDNYAYPYVQTPLLYNDSAAPYSAAPVIVGAQQPADNTAPSTQGTPGTAVAGAGVNSNTWQSFYSGPSASTGQTELIVKVPTSDAQVSLGSMQSEQTGTERQFYFPALSGDTSFTIRCQWLENGTMVMREKQINVRPGQTATIDFSKDSATKSE